MAPTVHLIRHAEGFHNLGHANQQLPDPLLTPTGVAQCYKLGEDFPYTKQIDLVVASPLKRAIYTALYAFDVVLREKDLQILALPEVQETSDLPCDTGSSVNELQQEFRGKPVDLNYLSQTWNRKDGKWSAVREKIIERAKDVREWLQSRKEDHIVVVTHGGFLHYLTEDWSGYNHLSGRCLRYSVQKQFSYNQLTLCLGTGWANTEFRTYVFDESRSKSANLIETEESKWRRLKNVKAMGETKRRSSQSNQGYRQMQSRSTSNSTSHAPEKV